MVNIQPLVSQFTIFGKLESFNIDSKGRTRYLYLSTSEANYSIEVAKEQKNILSKCIKVGCRLKVSGMQKHKLHQEEIIYKAYRIELISEPTDVIPNTEVVGRKTKVLKVLICQGSSCRKKGAKMICHLLQKELQTQSMQEVEVQTTGCLKQCKQAPNLIMPGGDRYSRVQPKQVPRLIEQHLSLYSS